MTDYNTANATQNKAIIQKLVEDCGDNADVANVLKCYAIESSGSDIRKDMSKQGLSALKRCGIYLLIYPEGEVKKLKKEIITDIITRINSLLRDLCGVCQEYYHNDVKDKPPFSCLICTQGCHTKCFEGISTMFNQLDENQRRAMQFICTSCYSDHKGDKVEEITLHEPKDKKSPTKVKPQIDDKDEELGEEKTHEVIVIADNAGDAPKVNNSLEEEEDPEITRRKARNKDPTVAICPDYKWGMCKNYESCEYRHPPRCYLWLSKGKCKFGENCRFHHPPLCQNSLQERKCLVTNCRFFHITNTIRPKRDEEQLKSSLHANTFHNQRNQLNQRNRQNQQPRNTNRAASNQVPAEYQYQSPDFPNLPQQQQESPWYQQQHQPQNRRQNQQQRQPGNNNNQPPQQQYSREPQVDTATYTNQSYQSSQSVNPPYTPHPSQNSANSGSFTPDQISFLVNSIKDLGKEITEIKHQLNSQSQCVTKSQLISQPQAQTFSLQVIPKHD